MNTLVVKRPQRSRSSEGRGAETRKYRNTSSAAVAAEVDENKPLTDMQRAFVKLWASGETILSASIKAGYADGGTFAYRLARMPNILRLYRAEKLAYEQASQMTRARVIEGFLDGIEMAKMLGEPSSVIAGWREVGKMCGYYEPVTVRHEVSHEGKVITDRLNRLSDAELLKLIEESARATAGADVPLLERVHDDDEIEPGADGGGS